MNFSSTQILEMKSIFTEVVRVELDRKFSELETTIGNITTDTETNKLLALQQLYLRKDILTIAEVTKAQLLGKKYTAETVLTKLKPIEGCRKFGTKYKIITSALISYREACGIR